jgi:acetylornithine deacetylase/succinyl-diaminopimelate desuccinylase-like protein
LLCGLFAAEAWCKAGDGPPINVKFLFEGEEEIGSPNLAPLVAAHRERMACDYVLIHDTSQYSEDQPAITTAVKGLVYKEIILTGPRKDLHSGSYGGQVANPATELARLLASFHDAEGRVTIPGFYDDVAPLTKDEARQIAQLPFSEADFLEDTGSPAVWGETGYSTVQRRWARPTFEVNGIYGGYSGPGSATLIPSRAGAKVSMRLVANQRADVIEKAFEHAVRSRCPDTVRLEIVSHAQCDPYLADLDSAGMRESIAAVESGFGRKPVLIRAGGSLPILPMFKSVLGADSLMLGYCLPTCNVHSPNEFMHVAHFEAGTRTTAALFGLLGPAGV